MLLVLCRISTKERKIKGSKFPPIGLFFALNTVFYRLEVEKSNECKQIETKKGTEQSLLKGKTEQDWNWMFQGEPDPVAG